MRIDQIFEIFAVDRALADHMVRAAAIAHLIHDRWTGPSLDWSRLIRPLLIHDIGVAVIRGEGRDGLHDELATLASGDRLRATALGAARFGMPESEQETILQRGLRRAPEAAQSPDYTLKISAYVDNRQLDDTVLPLAEIVARWPSYRSPEFTTGTDALFVIEEQLIPFFDGDLHALDGAAIAVLMDDLRRRDDLFTPVAA